MIVVSVCVLLPASKRENSPAVRVQHVAPQRERCVALFQEHYMSTLHNGFYVILDRFWIVFFLNFF